MQLFVCLNEDVFLHCPPPHRLTKFYLNYGQSSEFSAAQADVILNTHRQKGCVWNDAIILFVIVTVPQKEKKADWSCWHRTSRLSSARLQAEDETQSFSRLDENRQGSQGSHQSDENERRWMFDSSNTHSSCQRRVNWPRRDEGKCWAQLCLSSD